MVTLAAGERWNQEHTAYWRLRQSASKQWRPIQWNGTYNISRHVEHEHLGIHVAPVLDHPQWFCGGNGEIHQIPVGDFVIAVHKTWDNEANRPLFFCREHAPVPIVISHWGTPMTLREWVQGIRQDWQITPEFIAHDPHDPHPSHAYHVFWNANPDARTAPYAFIVEMPGKRILPDIYRFLQESDAPIDELAAVIGGTPDTVRGQMSTVSPKPLELTHLHRS